ncbi:MAG: DUF4926 domain-containing protein [Anaerolineae bacterium]|nr:DUF4926 domain-containing protein [Anaerolineae bacterium]
MKLDLYQRVMVNRDIPSEGLRQGDIAWLVEYLERPTNGEEYGVLEIFNVLGESLRIAVVPLSSIEALRQDQVPSLRSLAS